MSRAPKEKASESRKIHIPIFPGVALPYWSSGGQATAGWPCCEATVVLKRHLPLRARRAVREVANELAFGVPAEPEHGVPA